MRPVIERLDDAIQLTLAGKTSAQLAEFRRLKDMVLEKEAKGLVLKQPYSAPAIDALERQYSFQFTHAAQRLPPDVSTEPDQHR